MKYKLSFFIILCTIFINISNVISWGSDTLTLLKKLGDRKYYAQCNHSIEIIEQLNEIEGEKIYQEIFEQIKNKNPRCTRSYGLWLLKKKNTLVIDCLIYYMNPKWAEDLEEDPNYKYYWDILAKLSSGRIKPERTNRGYNRGLYYEYNIYSWKKFIEWWDENKKTYIFPLSDSEITEIFETIQKNKDKRRKSKKKKGQQVDSGNRDSTNKATSEILTIPKNQIQNFIKVVETKNFGKIAREGNKVFKKGLYIPNHSKMFKNFPSKEHMDYIYYFFLTFEGNARRTSGGIMLILEKDSSKVYRFHTQETIFW